MRVTVYYWSDAMIVLHWINGDPCRWKTFVANRIGSIQEVSSASQWGHVSTQDNPADCATRGLTPLQLAQDKLWWSGPDWLQEPEDHWPKVTLTSPDPSTICEEQAAFINRFIHNTRCKREARLSGPISVKEFSKAMYTLVRVVQQEAFSHELSKLRANKSLSKSNKLSQLSPFIDAQGILRVRGRLRNALQLTTQQCTPIILPKSHHFTDLVIKNAHLNTMHGGVQLTRAIIHQQFWIINGKQAVKRVLRQCVACFQHRPKPSRQLMGDLPYHRVNPPKRAFEATGVDYTGSIDVKASRFRGHTTYKAYIAVFICLASKAIHLDLVTGLTAQHFLWALQRFIGRRGFVRHMYSDCGTNFIAADKSLQLWSNEFRQEINQTVVPELTKRYIQWDFNPPHSPNFGGLWEANVKAIEACLNSRPLCPLTADINDLQVLTPAHFLIGDSMQSLPTPSDKDKSLNTQFMEGQRILRQLWKRQQHNAVDQQEAESYAATIHSERSLTHTIEMIDKPLNCFQNEIVLEELSHLTDTRIAADDCTENGVELKPFRVSTAEGRKWQWRQSLKPLTQPCVSLHGGHSVGKGVVGIDSGRAKGRLVLNFGLHCHYELRNSPSDLRNVAIPSSPWMALKSLNMATI
ncbi:uncharacterized protein [Drosophila bipectinata]|uniref:uncharacterized protein n=1 Tax=Drosophila bipectinata TaxID=42026 RepID=UPI0038B2539D